MPLKCRVLLNTAWPPFATSRFVVTVWCYVTYLFVQVISLPCKRTPDGYRGWLYDARVEILAYSSVRGRQLVGLASVKLHIIHVGALFAHSSIHANGSSKIMPLM